MFHSHTLIICKLYVLLLQRVSQYCPSMWGLNSWHSIIESGSEMIPKMLFIMLITYSSGRAQMQGEQLSEEENKRWAVYVVSYGGSPETSYFSRDWKIFHDEEDGMISGSWEERGARRINQHNDEFPQVLTRVQSACYVLSEKAN